MAILEIESEQEMALLGEFLGERACLGDLFFLCGDLGAGKTTLTQGIARGLGVSAVVDSPTFQIIKTYQGRCQLNHLDLYRLQNPNELTILEPDELCDQGVTVVEWGDLLKERLNPYDYLEICITRTPDSEKRLVTLTPYGDDAGRMVEGLTNVHFRN